MGPWTMPRMRLGVFSKVGVQPDSRTLKSIVELCFGTLDQWQRTQAWYVSFPDVVNLRTYDILIHLHFATRSFEEADWQLWRSFYMFPWHFLYMFLLCFSNHNLTGFPGTEVTVTRQQWHIDLSPTCQVKDLAKHMREADLQPTQRTTLVMLKTFLQDSFQVKKWMIFEWLVHPWVLEWGYIEPFWFQNDNKLSEILSVTLTK